jgi:hypothetical protein
MRQICFKRRTEKGEGSVTKEALRDNVGRRDFIKTTAMAGVAATIPGAALLSQNTAKPSELKTNRTQKKVLCLSDSPQSHERLVQSIKSIPGTDLLVTLTGVNYENPQEVLRAISGRDVDFLLICLPDFTFSFGSLYDSMGDLNIPIIILSTSPDWIMVGANLAASLRGNGATVSFAISEKQVLDLLKNLASPKILEGKKALLFSKPFDSISVPSHNLSADLIHKRTGVNVQFRSLEELEELFKGIDEARARSEMERWKKEAKEIVRVPDKAILDSCRLYILLRSLVDKEGLSAVSIDCLSFTMGMAMNSILPIPCLAFSRLRDEGITAACEADVCGMLSSMFLETISRKPSFMANVLAVNSQKSCFSFSHCVSPLKLDGSDAAPMRYRLHDYHNMGRGVVPEVEFPTGKEVMTGAFSKNLKSFALWPGRIQSQVKETELTTPSAGFGLNACANTIDIKIKDADRFLQNIESIHHVMVTGNYAKAIEEALVGMNVTLAGPSDFIAPGV